MVRGYITAIPKDYIIKLESGDFHSYTPSEFEKHYDILIKPLSETEHFEIIKCKRK